MVIPIFGALAEKVFDVVIEGVGKADVVGIFFGSRICDLGATFSSTTSSSSSLGGEKTDGAEKLNPDAVIGPLNAVVVDGVVAEEER